MSWYYKHGTAIEARSDQWGSLDFSRPLIQASNGGAACGPVRTAARNQMCGIASDRAIAFLILMVSSKRSWDIILQGEEETVFFAW